MASYLARRLLQAVFTLLAISVITFAVAKATPGGPFGFDDPDQAPRIPAEMRARYRQIYGLDKPVYVQYLNWLRQAVQGDFGISFTYRNEHVQDILARTWAVSAQLGLTAAVLAIGLGILIGIVAAVRQNSWIDYASMFLAIVGTTTPTFVLALICIVLFCVQFRIFPLTGWGTPNRMVLPVFVLMLGPLAAVARFTRASMLDVLNLDYVRTAYAKGLRPQVVIMQHVIKNALIPVVTISGPMIANLITGSFFVETMFNVPGMGGAFVFAAADRDYPMIMANAMLYGGLIVLLNLAVDVTYGMLDPRIRYQ